MKRKSTQQRIRRGAAIALTGVALAFVAFSASDGKSNYVAHEWGTFTSVQGSDGVLLDWRPLETSELPTFVYNWSKPGLNRLAGGLTKAVVTSLQRMETPVVYFYAKEAQTVDVSVQFPQGRITEWYPQANQIGPAWMTPPPLVNALDTGVRKLGIKPQFTFASFLPQHVTKDSRIVWTNVRLLPAEQHTNVASLLPLDQSGSHYFAARETDSAFVRLNSLSRTNPLPEYDKFLFYRGVGSFATPLRVSMTDDNSLTLTNTSAETLSDLFVLRVHEGQGQFIQLDQLGLNTEQAVRFSGKDRPQGEVSAELEQKIVAALTAQGLYPREATAMVNTWKDSWFTEAGVRVLYVLPRPWTDRTLPMQLTPQPQELVRVMVGRAELITPSTERRLCDSLGAASRDDAQARELALSELKRLGRFAEAALGRVTNTAARQTGWGLLQTIAESKSKQVASR
ncbi:MAG: hypothetical protein U1F83_20645 [Verrucomicrobiota bacterium]